MSVDVLPIESELAALLADGHSRTRATELVIERAIAEAVDASTVVLVEGLSDRIALEQQIHRFIASRKYRNARLLAEALDPASVPRPLDALLAHV